MTELITSAKIVEYEDEIRYIGFEIKTSSGKTWKLCIEDEALCCEVYAIEMHSFSEKKTFQYFGKFREFDETIFEKYEEERKVEKEIFQQELDKLVGKEYEIVKVPYADYWVIEFKQVSEIKFRFFVENSHNGYYPHGCFIEVDDFKDVFEL